MVTDADLDRMFHHWQTESQRSRFIKPRKEDPRHVLACFVTAEVKRHLEDRGYLVAGTAHSDHFDLMVEGCRIEVKGASWKGGRYQAALRSNDADVLVLGCLDGSLHFFVIPFYLVKGKSHVKISQHDPSQYVGRFTPFYEAWGLIDELIAQGLNPYQLHLFAPGGDPCVP